MRGGWRGVAVAALVAAGCSSSSSGPSSSGAPDAAVMDAAARDAVAVDTGATGDGAAADAGFDAGPACGLGMPGAACAAAHDCCQTGPGLPLGQTCVVATKACTIRCNTGTDCPAGYCCYPDSSSYPAFGSAPTEPGGFCEMPSSQFPSVGCVVGDANGYVCTGNDDVGFHCTPATTDAGPSGDECSTGVTAYCACQQIAGTPCSASLESLQYAECIDGLDFPFACYAGYAGTATTSAGCMAAAAACGS